MKTFAINALFALAPSAVLGIVCNADNVLRALQANSAKASPFCSTYTRPPPNQPLPTYVSAYPASRVSSGCSCLITPTPTTLKTATTSTSKSSTTTSSSVTKSSTTSTTSTTSSPTPTKDACTADHIENGGFQTLTNGHADHWIFGDATNTGTASTNTSVGSVNGNNYALLTVTNVVDPDYGSTSTYISQSIPRLCHGTEYTLTYSSQISIQGGEYRRYACSVYYALADVAQLVHIGPPSGDPPPFDYETRSYTFTFMSDVEYTSLNIVLDCNAPGGSYRVDDVSLVGTG